MDTSATSLEALKRKHSSLVVGQLLTPLTQYRCGDGVFAVDNGGYTRFDDQAFRRLLRANEGRKGDCLFVSMPDIVGSARRTLEVFRHYRRPTGWKIALVAQDGLESLDIPWSELDAIFIGGTTAWKDSSSAVDICKAASAIGKHVHVGRVNTLTRYSAFAAYADTCDGSGVCRYRHMLPAIEAGLTKDTPLFPEHTLDSEETNDHSHRHLS